MYRSKRNERCEVLGEYLIENRSTVRQVAQVFGISKSTVHKDIADRLSEINPHLAKKANAVLQENKEERHIRGGMATKKKYAELAEAKKRNERQFW